MSTLFLFFLLFIALNSGWYLLISIPLILFGPFFLTALSGTEAILKNGRVKIKEIFIYFKENFLRALISFLFTVILYLIIIFDLRFFLLKSQDSFWFLAFAFLFAYFLIYFSIYQAYLWPLLVIQKEKNLKIIFKNAVILSLDNLIFSLLWFLFIFLLTVLLFLTGMGVPAAFIGIIGSLMLKGAKEMIAKY